MGELNESIKTVIRENKRELQEIQDDDPLHGAVLEANLQELEDSLQFSYSLAPLKFWQGTR